MGEKKRYLTIDIMRTIGLFLVISAHFPISDFFYNFREFDVTLLMFLSGLSFYISYQNKTIEYKQYTVKRFKRLILPVWRFLILFFAVYFFILKNPIDYLLVLKTFLLTSSGISFFWIFRVMFTTSLINPFLKKLVDSWSPFHLMVFSLVVLLLNDMCYLHVFLKLPNNVIGKVLIYVVTYTVGYGMISGLGMIFYRMEKKQRVIFMGFWIIVSMLLLAVYDFAPFIDYKHPPTLYYISYGMACSSALFILVEQINPCENCASITWISKNSLSIYMWHVLFYYVCYTFTAFNTSSGIIRLVIVLVLSVFASWLESTIVHKVFNRRV